MNLRERIIEYVNDGIVMTTLVNDHDCLSIMMNDTISDGNSTIIAFLYSYMTYVPDMEPDEFDVCSVLLIQPQKDRFRRN